MPTESSLIHVVDDDETVLDSLTVLLNAYGYTVHCSHSGQELLAALRSELPDCLILDMRLPDADGLDFVRDHQDCLKGITIVIITGFGTPQAARIAHEIGVAAYLEKPDLADPVIEAARAIQSRLHVPGMLVKNVVSTVN